MDSERMSDQRYFEIRNMREAAEHNIIIHSVCGAETHLLPVRIGYLVECECYGCGKKHSPQEAVYHDALATQSVDVVADLLWELRRLELLVADLSEEGE